MLQICSFIVANVVCEAMCDSRLGSGMLLVLYQIHLSLVLFKTCCK